MMVPRGAAKIGPIHSSKDREAVHLSIMFEDISLENISSDGSDEANVDPIMEDIPSDEEENDAPQYKNSDDESKIYDFEPLCLNPKGPVILHRVAPVVLFMLKSGAALPLKYE
uniref:Uncharacterized protein n=1 Tax=Romanomermis culicivorax TaxID=13658 RepID=A0A915K265_ROMCU